MRSKSHRLSTPSLLVCGFLHTLYSHVMATRNPAMRKSATPHPDGPGRDNLHRPIPNWSPRAARERKRQKAKQEWLLHICQGRNFCEDLVHPTVQHLLHLEHGYSTVLSPGRKLRHSGVKATITTQKPPSACLAPRFHIFHGEVKTLLKQLKEGRGFIGSHFKGSVYRDREGSTAGPWDNWSHHTQEIENEEG